MYIKIILIPTRIDSDLCFLPPKHSDIRQARLSNSHLDGSRLGPRDCSKVLGSELSQSPPVMGARAPPKRRDLVLLVLVPRRALRGPDHAFHFLLDLVAKVLTGLGSDLDGGEVLVHHVGDRHDCIVAGRLDHEKDRIVSIFFVGESECFEE